MTTPTPPMRMVATIFPPPVPVIGFSLLSMAAYRSHFLTVK